ncbi:MAG TPA: hypothetical protein VEA37_00810, partial [Flavobacterium sp.]|nr:hypothetical protein [Flavobacterium sp.]
MDMYFVETSRRIMKNSRLVIILTCFIAILSVIATLSGILSKTESGIKEFTSIHGQPVTLFGKGIYRHMSAEVAIQGIAQDYVTLFLACPLLLLAMAYSIKGSLKWRLILAGVLMYELVTYTFYLNMAMFNALFLIYVAIAGLSFFSLAYVLLSFSGIDWTKMISGSSWTKFSGWFLMINAMAIALLWLGIIVPPLLDTSIYPQALEHYTTLIVQGNDLAFLLPLSFVTGLLMVKKRHAGILGGVIYLVFLSLLMT